MLPNPPARCVRHIGDEFPPRCNDCDLEILQAATERLHARLEQNPLLALSRRTQAIRHSFEENTSDRRPGTEER